MNQLLAFVLAISFLLIGVTHAETNDTTLAQTKILDPLKKARPEIVFGELKPSPVEGYFQVSASGTTLYIDEKGEHFFAGELISIKNGEVVSETEKSKADERLAMLAKVDPKDMIVFSPKGETKASITVFTDVTCTFCRKLHQEVAELNDEGIEVRYLAYPRSGLGTYEYMKTTTAWCSDDPKVAMTQLKNDTYKGADNICADNPVAEEFELGQRMGVTGTPAIIMPNGELVPGYRPVADFVRLLGLQE